MKNVIGLVPIVRSFLRRYRDDRRGSVAVIFGFALVSIIAAVGCAVDYSQAARTRSHIATSADAAALAAAKAAQTYMNTNGTGAASFTAASALALTAMTQTFTANQAADTYAQNATATLAMTQDVDGTPIATVSSKANAPTLFMKLFGIVKVAVSSTAQAKGAGGTYYQIVFLVDVSNSMAVGGTKQDITNLLNDRLIASTRPDSWGNVTSAPCAFACHDPNGVNQYSTSSWCNSSPNDYFCHVGGPLYCPFGAGNCPISNSAAYSDKRALAKKYGYKLKIDYVNSAISTFIGQLKPQMDKAPQYFAVSINTFGTSFAQAQAPTSDSTTLQTAASKIDIENAVITTPGLGNQGWTYTSDALAQTLAGISNVGDGSSSTKRKTYVIFLSDGVEDILDYPGVMFNRKTTLDYVAKCQAIQAAGITMFSIEAGYPPIPVSSQSGAAMDSQYQALVADLPSRYTPTKTIAQAMQQCASSSSNYFYADDGPGISAAVSSVFSNIFGVGTLHLSR